MKNNENISIGLRLRRLRESSRLDRKVFAQVFSGGRWALDTLKNVEQGRQKAGDKLVCAIEEAEKQGMDTAIGGRLGLRNAPIARVPISIPEPQIPVEEIIRAARNPDLVKKAERIATIGEMTVDEALAFLVRKMLGL